MHSATHTSRCWPASYGKRDDSIADMMRDCTPPPSLHSEDGEWLHAAYRLPAPSGRSWHRLIRFNCPFGAELGVDSGTRWFPIGGYVPRWYLSEVRLLPVRSRRALVITSCVNQGFVNCIHRQDSKWASQSGSLLLNFRVWSG